MQQFVALRHALTAQDRAYAQVHLRKFVDRSLRTDGFGLLFGSFVGCFHSLKLFYLSRHRLIFNLFEEEFGLADLMTGRQEIRLAQSAPIERLELEHAAQTLAAERQEGRESRSQIGHELEGNI